jgi:hypothetical protein
VSGHSCGFHATGDLQDSDPKLGRTGNHGGPTDTRELQKGSPAVNAGTNSGCPSTDQRGVRRPQGKTCDIGAYELAGSSGRGGPRLSRVKVTKRMKRGVGIFSYTLSEAAKVTITLHRGTKGRRVGRKCVRSRRVNRRRRSCTLYARVGKLAQSASKGQNRKRFKGKIGRRRLKPGSYRATLVAKSPSGVPSKPVQVKFKVVK